MVAVLLILERGMPKITDLIELADARESASLCRGGSLTGQTRASTTEIQGIINRLQSAVIKQ